MLQVSDQILGDVMVISCAGRLIAGEGDALRRSVLRASVGPLVRLVVLDLSAVDALDAAGIGLLVELHSDVRRVNRQLKLMNVSPRELELLRLTDVASVLTFCSLAEILSLMCYAQQKSAALASRDAAAA